MDYDYVQTEKANAMSRHCRIQNVAKMWRLFEVAAALALLSWTSTRLPVVVQFAGQCARQLSDYLFNPHINFVLGNAIIVVVVLLSRQSKSGERSEDGELFNYCVPTAVSDEMEQTPTVPAPAPEKVERPSPESREKQIVAVENVDSTRTQIDEVSLAINQATKQIRRFQRSQSAKLRRDLRGESPKRELRRSETVRASSGGAITSFETVDELSNEEFRRTIESFIENQQKFLWAQKMEETSY